MRTFPREDNSVGTKLEERAAESMAISDQITRIRLEKLVPDLDNPRIPPPERKGSHSETFEYIARNFQPLAIADSIARHGYWSSEPMVVLQDGDEWIVLEGNRRLTALAALADKDLRDQFPDSEVWEELADEIEPTVTSDTEVPVIEVDSREDAAALIGFRHISGVMQWTPVQRGRYLYQLAMDNEDLTFEDIAEDVGEKEDRVRQLYRNSALITELSEAGKDNLASQASKMFGTFSAALNRVGIRDYLQVETLSDVELRESQLEVDALDKYDQLFEWIYGSPRRPKAIGETRDLTRLSKVIQHPEALEALIGGADLDSAFELLPSDESSPDRVRNLKMGVGHLRSVSENLDEVRWDDEAVPDLLTDLGQYTGEIQEYYDELEDED